VALFPDEGFEFPVKKRRWTLTHLLTPVTLFLALLALVLSISALMQSDDDVTVTSSLINEETFSGQQTSGLISTDKRVSRIAYGSCTSFHLYPQPVWTQGVIPSDPDAWIWLGDIVYMDIPFVDCDVHPEDPQCHCDVTAFTYPPSACMTGNLTHAREKIRLQLLDNDYQEFLRFMCPDYDDGLTLPPQGNRCPKPVLGSYDDHDFGWNNGNRNLPNKYEFKNLYLDAIGEPQDSIRRTNTQGLQFKYTFNPDGPQEQTIDVFLLDERYDRDPLPCGVRKEWCEGILETRPENMTFNYAWCEDFLRTGGSSGTGSCCRADDEWAYGWCHDNPQAQADDPLWDVACDPSSVRFGSMQLEIDEATNTLIPKTSYENTSDLTYTSTFCDVLGPKQRRWLQSSLQESKAPLKLVVSPSVMFGNPTFISSRGPCSSDDIECYKVAQSNLAHILGRVDNGCVVVLTGDYHISDLKVLRSDTDDPYQDHYPTEAFKRPIYQAMSSGLTEVTAEDVYGPNSCRRWQRDQAGMRPLGECSHVVQPAFGIVEVDWESGLVFLTLRSSKDGSVTTGFDGSQQQIVFDLSTCEMI